MVEHIAPEDLKGVERPEGRGERGGVRGRADGDGHHTVRHGWQGGGPLLLSLATAGRSTAVPRTAGISGRTRRSVGRSSFFRKPRFSRAVSRALSGCGARSGEVKSVAALTQGGR